MAYIVKGDGHAEVTYNSALARAGTDMVAYGRQRDAYKLAKMGNRDMRRLWGDFAAECPAIARLIVAEVETDRAESARVAEKVDKRLRRAEESVTKSARPKVSKALKRDGTLTKTGKRALKAADASLAYSVGAWLDSPDPAKREAARAALEGLRG